MFEFARKNVIMALKNALFYAYSLRSCYRNETVLRKIKEMMNYIKVI